MTDYRIAQTRITDPLPEAFLFPRNNPGAPVMEPMSLNISNLSNFGYSAGSPPDMRPAIVCDWLDIDRVEGDRLFFSSGLRAFKYYKPTTFLAGASYYGLHYRNGKFERGPEGKVVAGHNRLIFQYETMEDEARQPDTIATGTHWRPGYWNIYRPEAPMYYILATVDQDGNQSEWAFAPVWHLPPAPLATVPIEGGPSGKRQLTGNVDPAIPQPQNIRAVPENDGKTVRIEWDELPAGMGVIIRRMDTDPREGFLDNCIDLPEGAGAAFQPGDQLTVWKEVPFGTPLSETRMTRTWNKYGWDSGLFGDNRLPAPGTCEIEHIDQHLTTPGVRLTLGPKAQRTANRGSFGGDHQTYYTHIEEGRTYKAKMEARLVSGTASAEIKNGSAGVFYPVPLTSEWAEYEVEIPRTVHTAARPVSPMEYIFRGGKDGGVIEVRVMGAWDDTGDLTFMGAIPEVMDMIRDNGIKAIRDHDAAKTRPEGPDLWGLTDRYGSLAMNLRRFKGVVEQFWMQIPPWLPADQWRGLVEYLAAPYDPDADTPESKPWAYRRFMDGQVEPWTDVYKLQFQAGNEAFNGMQGFWYVYGYSGPDGKGLYSAGEKSALIEDEIWRQMEASPYWPLLKPKIEHYAGGQTGGAFGGQALKASQTAHVMQENAYNGTDIYETAIKKSFTYSDEAVFALQQLSETRWRKTWSAKLDMAKDAGEARGWPIRIGVYEGQHSTPKPPGPDIPEDEVAAQMAAWWSYGFQTPIIDNFMLAGAMGFANWSFFAQHHDGSTYWSPLRKPIHGGGVCLSFQVLGLVSRLYLPGRIEECDVAISPRATATERGRTAVGIAQAFGFSINGQGKTGMLLRNRRVPGFGVDAKGGSGHTPFTVRAPQGVSRYQVYAPRRAGLATSNERADNSDALDFLAGDPQPIPDSRNIDIGIEAGGVRLIDYLP